MSKKYRIRTDLRSMMVKVKKRFPTLLKHIQTKKILLVSFTAKKCGYIAQITKNRYPWSISSPEYDYCIQFWENRFDNRPLAYQWYVMLHELYHISENGFDPKHKGYRRLRDHDIKDFSILLWAYGPGMKNVDKILKGEKAMFKLHKPSKDKKEKEPIIR